MSSLTPKIIIKGPSSVQLLCWRTPALFFAISSVAACFADPGGGGGGGSDGDPPWLDPPGTLNDGTGEGVFYGLVVGLKQTLAVGAPQGRLRNGTPGGLVSFFEIGTGTPPLEPHSSYSHFVGEDVSSSFCKSIDLSGQQFSWNGATSVGLGTDLAFYQAGPQPFQAGPTSLSAWCGILVAGAPGSSGGNGRLHQYREGTGCYSCSMFSQSPDLDQESEGNEEGTDFATSVAVGVFSNVDVSGAGTWRDSQIEHLAVGAPLWQGNGGVHIYTSEAFQEWRLGGPSAVQLSGSHHCEWENTSNVAIPRAQTLTGGLGSEEFGRVLAVADFTCDGYDDLAVGAPGADLPVGDGVVIEDAGAVYIFRGGPLGLGASGSIAITQGLFGTPGTPEAGDRFGEVISVGNFNGRRVEDTTRWSCWDLAVGTPNEDGGRGEVQIYYGDSGQVAVVGPIIRLGENGMPGVRTPGDRFGQAIVGLKADAGGFHDLAISAPGISGGRVFLSPGSPMGLKLDETTVLGQHLPTVGHGDDAGDEFGAALGSVLIGGVGALVVGAPGQDAGQGAVFVLELLAPEPAFEVSETTFLTPGQVDLGTGILLTLPGEVNTSWGSKILPPRAFPTRPFTIP